MQPLEVFTVEIEKLVVGGEGLSHLPDGRVVFIAGAIPGEKVEILLTQNKKDFARGVVQTILTPSPARQMPPCPYHGICGGCGFQHIKDESQRNFKQMLVEDELKRAFPPTAIQVLPILSAEPPFGYRHRIQLHQRDGLLGYHEYQSHKICAIDACLVSTKPINQRIAELQKNPEKRPRAQRFEISQVENQTYLKDSEEVEDFVFSQVNPLANEILKHVLLDWTGQNPAVHYVDLYCGNGNLSFPILKAQVEATLWGVEFNADSVRFAQSQKIDRALFFNTTVEQFLMNQKIPEASHLILDPPRAGLSAAVRNLISQAPVSRIFYVSCSLATFIRDAKTMSRQLNLVRVQPIDFFPQTPHIELIAEFQA